MAPYVVKGLKWFTTLVQLKRITDLLKQYSQPVVEVILGLASLNLQAYQTSFQQWPSQDEEVTWAHSVYA